MKIVTIYSKFSSFLSKIQQKSESANTNPDFEVNRLFKKGQLIIADMLNYFFLSMAWNYNLNVNPPINQEPFSYPVSIKIPIFLMK